MGYLYLLTSVLCGNIKGFCGKKTSSFTKKTADAVFFNFVRMLFCIAIGFCLIFFQNGAKGIFTDGKTVAITLFAGVTNALFVVSWLFAVQYGMYMTVDVSLTLGTVVPIILSSFIFGEKASIRQIFGLFVLVLAVYIMCGYNKEQKGKGSLKGYLTLFVCGFANGLTDFSQKLYVKTAQNVNIGVYNLYIYIFSALVLGIIFVFLKKDKTKKNFKSVVGYIFIMAVCLFGYSYFKTKSALFLPSVQLYPLSQSLSMIISTFMAQILFKEKITKKCVVGIVISFVALLLINM